MTDIEGPPSCTFIGAGGAIVVNVVVDVLVDVVVEVDDVVDKVLDEIVVDVEVEVLVGAVVDGEASTKFITVVLPAIRYPYCNVGA